MVLRALRHEAAVHAVPDRELRDYGDCLLLHDPRDREPFWNRLEAVRFPDDKFACLIVNRKGNMALFSDIKKNLQFFTCRVRITIKGNVGYIIVFSVHCCINKICVGLRRWNAYVRCESDSTIWRSH
jgi:hypothetical protein